MSITKATIIVALLAAIAVILFTQPAVATCDEYPEKCVTRTPGPMHTPTRIGAPTQTPEKAPTESGTPRPTTTPTRDGAPTMTPEKRPTETQQPPGNPTLWKTFLPVTWG